MKYYIALFQKLKELYRAINVLESDIPLLCPSLRVFDKEDLEMLIPSNLIEQNLQIEALQKKIDISYQLNSLPLSDKYWDVNATNTLFEVYEHILANINSDGLEDQFLNFDETQDQRLFKENKETKEYKVYKKYLNFYKNTIEDISNHFEKYQSINGEQAYEVWSEKLLLLKNEQERILAEFTIKGNKRYIEIAFNDINKKSELDKYVQLIETTQNLFELTTKTGSSLESYHDINFVPYDFMKNESGWMPLKLNKQELNNLFDTTKEELESYPFDILSLDYDEKFIEGIELDYAFVQLKRSWFNKEVLNSILLKWDLDKPISDGKSISTDFFLSAFPKTMILVKNLKINLNNIIDETQFSNQKNLIHFGPIIMKPQVFLNQSNNKIFIKPITNTNTLKSDNLNYLVSKTQTDMVESPVLKNEILKNTLLIKEDKFKNIVPKSTMPNVFITNKIIPSLNISDSIFIRNNLLIPFNILENIENTRVTFNLLDNLSKLPIYKCSITIIGIDNKRVIEIETNQNGFVTYFLSKGNYSIECRKDEYTIYKSTLNIENQNPIVHNYNLNRENILFRSYFLMGMICEKIPKSPKK